MNNKIMKEKTNFTKKELIIVLICAVFLLQNIGAIGSGGRKKAKEMVCIANVKHLTDAWLIYTDDNDGFLVGGSTRNEYYRWEDWVWSPYIIGGVTIEYKKQGIRKGALFPYVGNVNVYHCPDDIRTSIPNQQAFRSYSIADSMNGEIEMSWWYEPASRYSQIKKPAAKYVFVEESDSRGWNIGSWLMNPIQPSWVDPLALWHNCKTTLGFADGHIQMKRWSDWSTVEMSENHQFNFTTPAEDEDIRFMARGYMCRNE
jgi:hypothetical protein